MSYIEGHVDQDPEELRGIVHGLGVRSTLISPLLIGGTMRGVLQVDSTRPEHFSERDLQFLDVVARWVGMVAHRVELVEQLAAEAAARSRQAVAEELVTVLAHDLRNYLTPLKGRIELIHRRAAREQRDDYRADAEALSRTLARLNRLITDLLDVGRLEQGIFAIAPQPLDLVALVEETAMAFRGAEDSIQVEAPAELVGSADPDRLRQALENLVANALNYSPAEAPVRISVEREQRADGEWAVLAVSDQGPGISPELHEQLFTRFRTGPQSSGLGLGLYLARSIVEAHGGTLTLDSVPGAGARFCCALPLEHD